MSGWNQQRLYNEIILPFSRVIESMEHEGFYIDREKLEDVRTVLTEARDKAEKNIRQIAGNINIRSSQQVCKLLYDDLKIPDYYTDYQYNYKTDKWEEVKLHFRTDKGAKSADVFYLGIISAIYEHPVAKLLLAYRKVNKVISTYVEGIEKFITPDSRVHPSMFQMTAGGRISVAEPALATLPSRTEEGKLIKKFFIAPEGYSLVCCDYSGMELRFMAWICNDPIMFEAFKRGLDVHGISTSKLFGITYEEAKKDKKRRYIGKTVNFTIIFGGSEQSIQRTLLKDTGVFYSLKECSGFLDKYFETYKAVIPFQNKIKNQILDKQYVKNLWGRYRYFSGVTRKDTSLMDKGERHNYNTLVNGSMRQGMSHVIQSSSSGDYSAYKTIKLANLFKEGRFKGQGRLYFLLHDGFYCIIKDEYLQEFLPVMKETLEIPEEVCTIHLPVEQSYGKSWYEL